MLMVGQRGGSIASMARLAQAIEAKHFKLTSFACSVGTMVASSKLAPSMRSVATSPKLAQAVIDAIDQLLLEDIGPLAKWNKILKVFKTHKVVYVLKLKHGEILVHPKEPKQHRVEPS